MECDRALPLIEAIEGRNDDLLITRDGRRIGRLDPVFKGDLPINEAQIVQTSLDDIVVRLVPDKGFCEKASTQLISGIRERMGDINVRIETVDRIPRTKNGKFRAVVCEVAPTQGIV